MDKVGLYVPGFPVIIAGMIFDTPEPRFDGAEGLWRIRCLIAREGHPDPELVEKCRRIVAKFTLPDGTPDWKGINASYAKSLNEALGSRFLFIAQDARLFRVSGSGNRTLEPGERLREDAPGLPSEYRNTRGQAVTPVLFLAPEIEAWCKRHLTRIPKVTREIGIVAAFQTGNGLARLTFPTVRDKRAFQRWLSPRTTQKKSVLKLRNARLDRDSEKARISRR